jgi:F0F1-type ATP synthase assembly protein I
MTVPERPDKFQPTSAAQSARAWGLAMNFVYGVIGMGLIGWALERWLWPKAAPWLILSGCLIGLVAGMVRFIHDANQMYKK